jgi:hypothetical protein
LLSHPPSARGHHCAGDVHARQGAVQRCQRVVVVNCAHARLTPSIGFLDVLVVDVWPERARSGTPTVSCAVQNFYAGKPCRFIVVAAPNNARRGQGGPQSVCCQCLALVQCSWVAQSPTNGFISIGLMTAVAAESVARFCRAVHESVTSSSASTPEVGREPSLRNPVSDTTVRTRLGRPSTCPIETCQRLSPVGASGAM